MTIGLFILAVLLYLYWRFNPRVEYIKSSDMYILWYNTRNNQRKYLILWKNT